MSASEPYWGKIDANIDWCEPNYAESMYFAELWNSLSSVPISLFGLFGGVLAWKYGLTDTRHQVAWLALIAVGIGSTMFHATLRRYAQALDELPMLWGATIFLFNAADVAKPPLVLRQQAELQAKAAAAANGSEKNGHGHTTGTQTTVASLYSSTFSLVLKIVLSTVCIVATIIYLYLPQFYSIFLVSYVGTVLTLVSVTNYNMFFHPVYTQLKYQQPPPSVSATEEERNNGHSNGSNGNSSNGHVDNNEDATLIDPETKRKLSPQFRAVVRMFQLGLFLYCLGTVIWLIENGLCSSVPLVKHLRLHAIWHVIAGLGSYFHIQASMAFRGVVHQLRFRTRHDLVLPYVELKIHQQQHIQ